MLDLRRLRPRSLTARLAAWVSLIFVASMAIFGAVAYAIVYFEERDEADRESVETTAEIASDLENEVLGAMAAAAPLGLLLSVGGAIWISRRALAPLKDVMRAATEISANRLDRRLPVPPADDELARLVVSVNALLARLEAGFAAQARFAAAASHELRTPLAVIAGQLEVALRRPRSEKEWVETASAVLDEVRRLNRLGEALLRLRRAEVVDSGEPASADLPSVIEAVVARAANGGDGPALRVGDLPAMRVRGDSDELAAAIGNVVANAVRATPAAGQIAIYGETEDARVRVHIADDGPGVDEGDREKIFAAFARGEGSDGFGLGLTIARAIVEGTGGSLRLEPRQARPGAHFVFTLVAAAPGADWR